MVSCSDCSSLATRSLRVVAVWVPALSPPPWRLERGRERAECAVLAFFSRTLYSRVSRAASLKSAYGCLEWTARTEYPTPQGAPRSERALPEERTSVSLRSALFERKRSLTLRL